MIGPFNDEVLDYIVPTIQLDIPFEYNILDRSYWLNKPEMRSKSLEIYTDGSKLNERVGCGISIGKLNKSMSYRLPDTPKLRPYSQEYSW